MEGDLQIAFGRNVRALRIARGLSQEELAERIDVHRTFVGGVERGERNLTLRTVERLCSSLHADPLDMLAPDDVPVLRAAASGADPGPDQRKRPKRRS